MRSPFYLAGTHGMAPKRNFERFGVHLERLAGITSSEIELPSYWASLKIVSRRVPREMGSSGVDKCARRFCKTLPATGLVLMMASAAKR